MEDSDDAELLSAEAPADPAIVIALILYSFRHASPPAPSSTTVGLPPAWGCHAPQSERRIGDNTDVAASSRRISNKNDATSWRQRRSLMMPLEHRDGSNVSESCNEETLAKRSDIGGLTGGFIGPETKELEVKQKSKAVLVARNRELRKLKVLLLQADKAGASEKAEQCANV